MKRTDLSITMKGNPVTIVGGTVKIGDKAPDFVCLGNALNPVHLSDFKGKNVVIAIYPSVDTGVCAAQNRRFNTEANKLTDTVVLSISCDLPFAQSRFCAAEGLENIITLSDHKDLDFGKKYGFVVEELRLLTRGTVIIDKTGTIRYIEYVSEITDEPDYKKALEMIQSL
ncbi:MAG: thiol peroxidase [Bacteroidaceae bacterium]|nr:thiol peroxidase [Bacteroidaceae bacterium]